MSRTARWLPVLLLGVAIGAAGAGVNWNAFRTTTAAPPPTVPAAAPAGRPNIVFMMTDNLGYGEVGCYGGGILRGAPTPRIDQLATEGYRLLNYNVEAQCTPSRSALMTGRFPLRSGTMRVNRGGALSGLTQWE